MSYYQGSNSYSGWGGYGLPPVVKNLILINVAGFFLANIFKVTWIRLFGLVPVFVISRFAVWQLCTYMFVHQGLTHLLFNMLTLFFFGPALEINWGRKQFLIFFFFPMKIKYAVILFGFINLWGAVNNPWGGIAYVAHLGGGLCGYLYLKHAWLRRRLSSLTVSGFRKSLDRYRGRVSEARTAAERKEVDRILDKVSRRGIESLTPRERDILRRHSRNQGIG